MCPTKPSIKQAEAPAPAPAPPSDPATPPNFGTGDSAAAKRVTSTKRSGRNALKIDLAAGSGMGRTGLNIPT